MAVVDAGFCAVGGGTGFLTVALDCAAGVLATTATGLAGVVVAVLAVAAFLVVAVLVAGATALEEAALAGCVAVPLVGDIDVLPAVIVVAEVVPVPVAGAQGALLALFGAAGGAVAAAFFFPKSDPRLEIALVAFVTALLALAGT